MNIIYRVWQKFNDIARRNRVHIFTFFIRRIAVNERTRVSRLLNVELPRKNNHAPGINLSSVCSLTATQNKLFFKPL
ncbi:MAG: hypothetical protein Q4D65_00510, partial [Peptostreptococcaceae bacterium]|nr:hypothetical protein [Peptostreptococcaceae bacterium]